MVHEYTITSFVLIEKHQSLIALKCKLDAKVHFIIFLKLNIWLSFSIVPLSYLYSEWCQDKLKRNLVMLVEANRKNTQIGFKSCNDISRPKVEEDGCSLM